VGDYFNACWLRPTLLSVLSTVVTSGKDPLAYNQAPKSGASRHPCDEDLMKIELLFIAWPMVDSERLCDSDSESEYWNLGDTLVTPATLPPCHHALNALCFPGNSFVFGDWSNAPVCTFRITRLSYHTSWAWAAPACGHSSTATAYGTASLHGSSTATARCLVAA
jgi:hypothetical protein